MSCLTPSVCEGLEPPTEAENSPTDNAVGLSTANLCCRLSNEITSRTDPVAINREAPGGPVDKPCGGKKLRKTLGVNQKEPQANQNRPEGS